MPFTIGQHLTLDLKSWWGEHWLRGRIVGLDHAAWCLNELMLAEELFEIPQSVLTLDSPAIKDALIPARQGRQIELISPNGHKKIRLDFRASSLPQADAALWVTHCDPAGRFFCIEPWIGWPNGLSTGQGRVELAPGLVWEFSTRIQILKSKTAVSDAYLEQIKDNIHVRGGLLVNRPKHRHVTTSGFETATEES